MVKYLIQRPKVHMQVTDEILYVRGKKKSKLPHPRHPLLEANSIMLAAHFKDSQDIRKGFAKFQ